MKSRVVGLVLIAIGLGLQWFFMSANAGKIMMLFFTFISGCGVYQVLFAFPSVGAAISNLMNQEGANTSAQLRRLLGILTLAGGTIGSGMLFQDESAALRIKEYTDNGVVTTATVVDGWEKTVRRSNFYTLKLKFTDQAGNEREIERTSSDEKYWQMPIGTPVNIIYSTQKPDMVEILWTKEDSLKYGK